MEMRVKVCKLIWQDVGVRNDVELFLPKFLLHLDHIIAQPVFPCEFKRLWEVVDLLSLPKAFILIQLE